MTMEKREAYFEIINSLCGIYSVKSMQYPEMRHSPMMDKLWEYKNELKYHCPNEDYVKDLIALAKTKLSELEVFGHADFGL